MRVPCGVVVSMLAYYAVAAVPTMRVDKGIF